MSSPILARDQVARELSVPTRVLLRYEALGLVRAARAGDVEGYGPAEIRRLWTIVTCQRDLGINLAGVEAVLKLRDYLGEVHQQLDALAARLRETVDRDNDMPGHPDV
jgi:MerR family transcriptional regulator/heat shock protein HspR